MKGKLQKDDGGWVIEYKEFPVIYFMPLHPEDLKYINGKFDNSYFKIVEFDIINGYAKLIDYKSVSIEDKPNFWDVIKSALLNAFKHGQDNYKMMEAGLEGDESEQHVNQVMKELKDKYNTPTKK